MGEYLDYFRKKRNFLNLLILAILILALPMGVNFARRQQIIKSRATNPPIVFAGANVEQRNDGSWIARKPQISLEITSPLGPPAGSQNISNTSSTTNVTQSTATTKPAVSSAPATNTTTNNNVTPTTAPANTTSTTVDAKACQDARDALSKEAAVWKTATCQEIQAMVCTTPTVFVAPNPTRTALCSNYVPPAPLPAPPSSWNLPGWSTIRSNLDRWGNDINNSTGQWPSYEQWLQAIKNQMPSAPASFAQTALDYFVAYNAKWGYMFPNPDPLPEIFKKWQEAGNLVQSKDSLLGGLSKILGRLTDLFVKPAYATTWSACSNWNDVMMEGTTEDKACKQQNPDFVAWKATCTQCSMQDWGACGATYQGEPNRCPFNAAGAPNGACVWWHCETKQPPNSGSCGADHQTPNWGFTCTTCIANTKSDLVYNIRSFDHQRFDGCSPQQIVNYWCNGGVSPEGQAECVNNYVNGACKSACTQVILPPPTPTPPPPTPTPTPTSTPTPTPTPPPPTPTPTPPPPPVTTKSFRVAENPSDLNGAQWKDYISDPTPLDFEFKDKNPGQKFVWVEFKSSDGTTERHNKQIKLLGPDPTITGCALTFEGTNTTVLNLTGQDFGTAKGTIKSNETDLQVREWKANSIKAVWSNAPEGQALPVSLSNPDGQSGEGQCSSVSRLALGAKVFCRAPSQHDTNNVELALAGAFEGGTKVRQKVQIDREGIIVGLNQRLEEGKAYGLSLKAPHSLRRTVPFTAAAGTTNIPNFTLPIGDIFPSDGGDGVINTLDKAELNREWIISLPAINRSGDFNLDGRVNSIDWACMRYDFGSSDEPEPSTSKSIGVGST